MEDKTRKLLLALELLALLTAGILILIDYKLKQDLVTLTKNVEHAIEDARRIFPENAGASSDTSGVHTGDMVGNDSPVETGTSASKASQNGKTAAVPRTRTSAKRSGGDRNTQVPGFGNPVGS